jgi:hypothetical protein
MVDLRVRELMVLKKFVSLGRRRRPAKNRTFALLPVSTTFSSISVLFSDLSKEILDFISEPIYCLLLVCEYVEDET